MLHESRPKRMAIVLGSAAANLTVFIVMAILFE